jgi:hypothetical protein
MNPTPFEQSYLRAADAGLALVKCLAVNKMIVNAKVYESQMAELGGGVPPLGETTIISMMWNDITGFAVGDA